jgi:hypothetical protein
MKGNQASGRTVCASMMASGAPCESTPFRSARKRFVRSALDVYIWLAYRLHVLKQPTPVTWAALHGQFGAGFKAVRQLKPTLREALTLALAVYPEAKVGEETSGIILYPSLPAVPRADAKRLGLG